VAEDLQVLKPEAFAHYIEHFNAMEDENVTNFVSNAQSWEWLQQNIPFFECPDREVEEIYYFRWWSFRKHIVQTKNGFVITEFLTPVKHAGIYNSISCAAGFHLAEGRWLHNPRYLDDYTKFWFHGEDGRPPAKSHNFSSWLAAAAYDRYLVNGDRKFVVGLLNDLVADYSAWEAERKLPSGLFWQFDVRDGMEESISGSRTAKNIRPTINSYMFANAQAIAAISRLEGKQGTGTEYEKKAAELKRLTQTELWDADAKFFKVRLEDGKFSSAREEIGFIPWMFGLPDPGKGCEAAWEQLTNPQGFRAPFGITTAERRHSQFRSNGVGTCEWDGAVWPFATSQTLNALANCLRDYQHVVAADVSRHKSLGESQRGLTSTATVTSRDYFDAFLTFVHSQHADGKPYIGEYLDEVTGDWINGKNGRSRYYNHSTFADLLITGVVGLHPRADDVVEIYPLLPDDTWDWFCLDGVKYHGHMLTILWDKDGSRYGRGAGLIVLADGKQIARAKNLMKLDGKLP
jgi:Trehalase